MKKVKILINDPGERFKAGETGTLLFNDFSKYDHKVLLDQPVQKIPKDDPSFFAGMNIKPIFYFYADEVEML
jgi:hypothetical protein